MKSLLYITAILISLTFFSCSDDDDAKINDTNNDNNQTIHLISSADKDNFKISVFSDTKELSAGYSKLYYSVETNDGKAFDTSNFTMKPEMDMGQMHHACPYGEIGTEKIGKTTYFTQEVFFQMASGDMHKWSLDMTFDDADGNKVEASVSPEIMASDFIKMFTVGDKKYLLTLIEPNKFKAGNNDIYFALHSQNTMMDFPAENELEIEFTPKMPSMGHGSEGNTAPVSMGNGWYKGNINFSMTGAWTITTMIKKDTELLKELVFNIEL